MTLMPEVNRILDNNNAVNPVRQRLIKIPYQDKFDADFDFDLYDLISTGNTIIDENGNEQQQNIDISLSRGIRNIKQWVRKVLNVEINVFPIFTNVYGFGLLNIIGKGIPNEVIETMLPNFLSEALTYHPNILSVKNVVSNYENDNLYVTFDMILDDNEVLRENLAWVIG